MLRPLAKKIFFLASVSAFMVFSFNTASAVIAGDIPPKDADTVQKTEDIDKTIDKAIKVLTVIREELKEDEKSSISAADTKKKEEEAAAAAGEWISKINRMWKNIRKAVADDTKGQGNIPEPDVIDTKEISSKLGQAIEMMTTIKEELEKDPAKEKE